MTSGSPAHPPAGMPHTQAGRTTSPEGIRMATVSRPRVLPPVGPGPGAVVHTRAERRLAAGHWLLAAHPRPGRARRGWDCPDGMVLLPLGGLFAAVRIPQYVVAAAADVDDRAALDVFLAEALGGGPVICDPRGHRYYPLVPASVLAWWSMPDAPCLGRDHYLGVPRLDQTTLDPRAWRSYWSVPMESAGVLCDPLNVARLGAVGSSRAGTEDAWKTARRAWRP
ncbi:hypothetical protein ACX6XY_21200 [Streptomyces sp. O3]